VSRRLQLTALMSDLEGYTEASERLEPQTLMDWINEYINAMAQTVEAHGGVVDDYAGDGVKANFGFPVPSESEAEIDERARAAVRCALAMGARMDALNASWRERGLPTGRCRVGVFTGPAVVGCIGGDRSLKLTSVGDTINTAARLEGFAKDVGAFGSGRPDHRGDPPEAGGELAAVADELNLMATGLERAREDLVRSTEERLELERHVRQSERMAMVGRLAAADERLLELADA